MGQGIMFEHAVNHGRERGGKYSPLSYRQEEVQRLASTVICHILLL